MSESFNRLTALLSADTHVRMFDPDDLNRLQSLFDDCLEQCSLSRECEAAEALGSAIIRLFSQGQRDPSVIKRLLLPSFKRRSAPA